MYLLLMVCLLATAGGNHLLFSQSAVSLVEILQFLTCLFCCYADPSDEETFLMELSGFLREFGE